jgi:hypothetical protein
VTSSAETNYSVSEMVSPTALRQLRAAALFWQRGIRRWSLTTASGQDQWRPRLTATTTWLSISFIGRWVIWQVNEGRHKALHKVGAGKCHRVPGLHYRLFMVFEADTRGKDLKGKYE